MMLRMYPGREDGCDRWLNREVDKAHAGPLSEYRADLSTGSKEEYANHLAAQGLAWWCEFEWEKLERHLTALEGPVAPMRVRFLRELCQATLDQDAFLDWFEQFIAQGDAAAAAVVAAAAITDIRRSGRDFRRFAPWRERGRRVLETLAASPLPAAALLAHMAVSEMLSEPSLYDCRQTHAACRRMTETAHSLAVRLFQLSFEAQVLYWAGEFSAAEVLLEDARVLNRQPGLPYLAGLFLRATLCLSLALRGDPLTAREAVQGDVSHPGFDALPPETWLAVLSNLVHAAALSGDEAAVKALGERMRQHLVPIYNTLYHSHLHAILGVADLLLGRPAAALAHAREARELGMTACCPLARHLPVLLEVQARVDLGDLDGALALADAWLPKWREAGLMAIASKQCPGGSGGGTLPPMPAGSGTRGPGPGSRPAAQGREPHPATKAAHYLAQLEELLVPRRGPAVSPLPLHRYPIAIHTLNGLRMRMGDRVLYERHWHGNRVKSLLKALVVSGGHMVSTTALAEMLWPDAEGDSALANLKVAVWRLRQVCIDKGKTSSPWLLMYRGRISLAQGTVGVDAHVFRDAATDALRRSPLDRHALMRVLDLYEGDFLAGDDSEIWIIDYRQERKYPSCRKGGHC